MLKLAGNLSLVDKSQLSLRKEHLVLGCSEDLDGDISLQLSVISPVDGPHPTLANLALEFEMANNGKRNGPAGGICGRRALR